ncbi:MAG TPA: beta-galactosidase [Candidatus Hydrogenedentes bacterium]|nr:beta-galactosidase [Candidatus Hydrogenedentota bacterium]
MPLFPRIVCALTLLIASHGCAAVRAGAPAFSLGAAVETPHVPWAKPLEGGPVRGLLVAPRHTLRDAVELAQRLDIHLEVVPLWDRAHLGYDPALVEGPVPGASMEETNSRLNSLLHEPFDVIILGNVDLNAVPVEIQSQIFRSVSGGAGLLLVNCDPASGVVFETFVEALKPIEDIAPVTRGVGESMTPEWYGGLGFVEAATYGEGRVVLLPFREDKPATHCFLPALANPVHAVPEFLDSYFSLVARAVCWAAGRDSDLWVMQVDNLAPEGPPEEEIPPDLPSEFIQTMRDSIVQSPIRAFRLRFNRPADRAYDVTVQLRDPNRGLRVVYDELRQLRKGADAYVAEVLAGPGRYLLDFQLRGRRGIVMWHSESVAVEGWPSFTDLRLSKTFILPHDSVDISLKLRTVYGEARPLAIYARGIDALDRLVAENAVPAPEGGGDVSLALPFADLIAPSVKIEVYAVPGELHTFEDWELNMAAAEVRVLPVRQVRLPRALRLAAVAPAAYEYNARHMLDILADAGLDAVYTDAGAAAHLHLTRLNLRPIAEAARIAADHVEEGLVRGPCLSDPSYGGVERTRLAETVRRFGVSGVLDYSLGNPAYFFAGDDNVCQCAHCLASFRTRLKADHPNARSGRSPDRAIAPTEGLHGLNAAWSSRFTDWAEVRPLAIDQARELGCPASWVDFRRFTDSTFTGFLDGARAAMRGVDPQARVGFRARNDGGPMRGYDWPTLARTMDWLAIDPDPALEARLRSYKTLATSVALCLDGGTLRSAEHARWLPWHALAQGCDAVWLTEPFGTALDAAPDAALAPDGRPAPFFAEFAASYAAVAHGLDTLLLTADPAKARVAVYDSPASRYCDAVMHEGGTRYDEAQAAVVELLDGLGVGFDFLSGEDLEAGRLGEYAVLVLPMTRALSDREIAAITDFAAQGGRVVADFAPGEFDEHGVRRTALPAAGSVGEGGSITTTSTSEEEGQMGVVLRRILAEAEIASDAPLAAPEEDRLPGVRRRYRFGDADLTLIVRAPEGGPEYERIRPELPRDGHVYDLINGLPVRGRQPRFSLARGEALLLAHLPYEVAGLDLTTPKSVSQGDRLPFRLTVKARDGMCGVHLVRITLETMRGEHLEHYTQVVRCESGQSEGFLPLARNERIGHYLVKAHDLLSGTRAQAVVQVTPRAR